MKLKELTMTIMMITNYKKTFGLYVLYKNIAILQRIKGWQPKYSKVLWKYNTL